MSEHDDEKHHRITEALRNQMKAEISSDALTAMLSNPSVDIRASDLPEIALNHASTLMDSLERCDTPRH